MSGYRTNDVPPMVLLERELAAVKRELEGAQGALERLEAERDELRRQVGAKTSEVDGARAQTIAIRRTLLERSQEDRPLRSKVAAGYGALVSILVMSVPVSLGVFGEAMLLPAAIFGALVGAACGHVAPAPSVPISDDDLRIARQARRRLPSTTLRG